MAPTRKASSCQPSLCLIESYDIDRKSLNTGYTISSQQLASAPVPPRRDGNNLAPHNPSFNPQRRSQFGIVHISLLVHINP